jgi:carboxypeptidase Taq
MGYEEKFDQLKEIIAEVADLNAAQALLGWDQQVNMPPGGAEGRGYALGTLGRLAHVRFTSPEVGQLLDELQPYAADQDPDSDFVRTLKVTRRHYDKQTKVPPEWVVEFAQLTTQAHQVWAKARAGNDFASFQPLLEKLVDLRRRYADYFAPYEHVYDPLLDDFEPGLKTADVKQIFETLRPQQVALIKAIAGSPQVDASFLYQPFDEQKQWDLGVELLTRIGYDWNRSRQDKAPHPFTSNSGSWDVRITTRVDPNYLGSALFATLHEAGHAMYELGVDPALNRTALSGGTSLAVHESQSRMWENLVGRSLPFWEGFYPLLQQYFPEQFNSVPLEAFYKGINRVQPSLIRVEADEATYNLHIMLRLEIEIALLEGKLAVKDLPEVWDARMQEYLGLTPPDDSTGVLQDVHWSGGMIGYFSTYSLGNLVSAQLWEVINRDIPDLPEQIRSGKFDALHGWLVEKVHRHGSRFEPQELVQRVTGSKIDPAPYLRYLQNKFGSIYGLV